MLPCFKHIRNHASGGNCNALKIKSKDIYTIEIILNLITVQEKILPTNKISNDICMAYKNSVRIMILTRFCTMKIFSKCCLYSRPILEELKYR